MRIRSISWTLLLGFLFSLACFAQKATPLPPPPRNQTIPVTADGDDSQQRLARDMAKKANQERQAALKSDTEKLVKLAGELKEYVDKSNENLLSLDVLKKAEEIEKLAHSVKQKMKGAS